MANNISKATEPMKINEWKLGKTIGTGSFGKVKLLVNEVNGVNAAVKIVSREKMKQLRMVDKARREIENLRLLCHPHIVKLYEVHALPFDIVMIMEYVSGGDMCQYLCQHGKLAEHEARRLFQQLISAVDYCHRHKVVHRDLKLENLLLDSKKNIKLTDFGLSNYIKDGVLLKTNCGSLIYAAPELLHRQYYAGPEVDIWSCGIVLYVLLCGYFPFEDDRMMALCKKITTGVFKIPKYIGKSVSSLICKILKVHPMERATVETIMAHPWFARNVPNYLFPKISDEETSIVDLSVVKQISRKFHAAEKKVITVLKQNDPYNRLSIAYNLAVEKKHREKNTTAKILAEDYPLSNMSDISKERPPNSNCSNDKTPEIQISANIKPIHYKSPYTDGDRLYLGLRWSDKPENIMMQLLHLLKSLNFEWRMINPYHVIVRRKNDLESPKMILQLYTVGHNDYVLDFTSSMETTADTPSDLLKSSAAVGTKFEPKSSIADENRPSTSAAMDQGPSTTAGSDVDAAPPSSQIMQFFEMCMSVISAMSK
ncbi:5'-AMP-activated protein kinase catalytic subunit alpha-2 [Trichinella patagoniensis]|uniref:5'-AMP-activated protein kinase catalytic subunit alpha-2 n=1 Tax=Trichinella patagoniensis TaxID=990121 RepID=A0A0V0ZJ07_9BILA|nr:5'-AMP-activated protein kinase catalytic subunit alpha-2 [Trichinella patagoniensis]